MELCISTAKSLARDIGEAVDANVYDFLDFLDQLKLASATAAPPPVAALKVTTYALDLGSSLGQVERYCQQNGCLFTDPDFPPSLHGRVTSWSRPQDITMHEGQPLGQGGQSLICGAPLRHGWELFRGEPCADDVEQGELGDCWFLSSLAALAEFQGGRFVRALFRGQDQVSPGGVYLLRLCLGGCWRDILVDDLLPCIGGGKYYRQLGCCVTHRRQLWASLIEKGLAKACGSYRAIDGGDAGEALSMLTGWPCTTAHFNRRDFDPEILWATLCSARDAGFLMTCSTEQVSNSSMLEPYHVYSLMDIYELESEHQGIVRLLKIRNPNAKTTWTGAWSNTSSLWTPALREQVEQQQSLPAGGGGDPLAFFMAFGDFLCQFAHCTICKIRSDDWQEVRKPLGLPGPDAAGVGLEMTVDGNTECSISLVQPEERLRQGPFYKNLSGPSACIGFVVLRNGGPRSVKEREPSVKVARLRCRDAVNLDCWLEPGKSYMLVPLCLRVGPGATAPLPVNCACVSSRPVALEERCLERDVVRNAWASYAKAADPRGERSHGAVLHMAKGEGGSVVAYAENRGSGYFKVELSFASDYMSFSRGKPTTGDWLAPGFGQVVQVAQPDLSSGGASKWCSNHKFFVGKEKPGPTHTLHSPAVQLEGDDLHTPFRLCGDETL
mmetsp:Transcript_12392/g.35098  ORF Transcript_12392/g.35098 Transcript_12392/m.35098 type:complete len:667 (-) Transcript_12392:117-2117(-)